MKSGCGREKGETTEFLPYAHSGPSFFCPHRTRTIVHNFSFTLRRYPFRTPNAAGLARRLFEGDMHLPDYLR